MYANRTPEFYKRYADAVAQVKRCSDDALPSRLSDAFNSVYRLVAFDIDGTLTPRASAEITEAAAHLIGSLLGRGVEVLLITGRGRGATRQAAETIAGRLSGPRRRFQRLSAVTSNGMYLLETGPEESLLQRELVLSAGPTSKQCQTPRRLP